MKFSLFALVSFGALSCALPIPYDQALGDFAAPADPTTPTVDLERRQHGGGGRGGGGRGGGGRGGGGRGFAGGSGGYGRGGGYGGRGYGGVYGGYPGGSVYPGYGYQSGPYGVGLYRNVVQDAEVVDFKDVASPVPEKVVTSAPLASKNITKAAIAAPVVEA